jgi:CPA1 family monovalent cation:H+ antiporter
MWLVAIAGRTAARRECWVAMSALYLALGFLATAALVSTAAARVRVPYTTALVLVGLAAGALHIVPAISVSPDAIVIGLIVPLLFEGAVRIPRGPLWTYAPLILALAVPGTLVSAAVIAAAAVGGAGLLWAGALVLGAVCAATDPAGVIALVRESRLDERLGTILEGEAVANDAVAIVLFSLAAAAAPLGAGAAAAAFVWLLVGGAAAGVVIGAAVAYALLGVTDAVVEAIGSMVGAIASFAAAEAIHASGVIGVVAAGITFAGLAGRGLTPVGRETVEAVWDVIAFLANSALFLLVGLLVPWPLLVRHAGLIGIVIFAALAARALAVYGFSAWLAGRASPVPASWRHVLVWSGLRGGVAVALVLALPPALPHHDAVAAGILGLVIWTLIVQGVLVEPLLRWTGLHAPERLPAAAKAAARS